MNNNVVILEGKIKYHYWVGCYYGLVVSTSATVPIKNPISRLKYLGYSYSVGWPRRLNTGRLLMCSSLASDEKRNKRVQKNEKLTPSNTRSLGHDSAVKGKVTVTNKAGQDAAKLPQVLLGGGHGVTCTVASPPFKKKKKKRNKAFRWQDLTSL